MIANCSRLLNVARMVTCPRISRAFAERVSTSRILAEAMQGKSIIRAKSEEDLTPFQNWCVNGGVERAYTGNLWYERDVGTYNCVRCEKELFRSDQKYFPNTGMGSFWTHNEGAIEVKETDIKQEDIDTSNIVQTELKHPSGTLRGCHCSDCSAFLGIVYPDGPAPSFTRYSINSGSVYFKSSEWFDDPSVYKLRRKEMNRKQNEEMKTSIKNRVTLDKSSIDSNIAEQIIAHIEKQDTPDKS